MQKRLFASVQHIYTIQTCTYTQTHARMHANARTHTRTSTHAYTTLTYCICAAGCRKNIAEHLIFVDAVSWCMR